MNDSGSCCIWSRRTRRMHCLGITAILTMATFVGTMRCFPERTWTTLVPVLKAPPYEHRYSDQDLRLWVSTRDTIPVQQTKLKNLRNQIEVETAELRRWISDAPGGQLEKASSERTLRGIAEELHQQASKSELAVKMIRIEPLDRILSTKISNGGSSVSMTWHPITLRVEGNYQQVCRFLHQLNEEHPTQCHRLKWTALTDGSPMFQLELVLAFAIADEKTLFELDAKPTGANEA